MEDQVFKVSQENEAQMDPEVQLAHKELLEL
jgi:hypothetical protein